MTGDQQRQFVNAQLRNLQPSDTEPYSSFEIEPWFTLVAKPPEHVKSSIAAVVSNLQKSYPGHYYYNPDQYHATLLGLGSNKSVLNKLSSLESLVKNMVVPVKASGLGANKYGASVALYPVHPRDLIDMRARLRDLTGADNHYAEHHQVWEGMLWINFMRYREKPSSTFLQELQSYSDKLFGEYTIDNWQLYKTTSRVLAPKASTLVMAF